MKRTFIKNLTTGFVVVAAFINTGCSSDSSSSGDGFVQIERLARPAINEGLILSNANLNAFNSIAPSLDLESSNSAVAAVLNEAVAVLTVVFDVATNAGTAPPAVTAVAGQFLPDVMRISVDDAHYGTLHTVTFNVDRTSNSRQNEVAYTSCVSLTSGAPLLCGGRKIRDDVIDITLSYLVNGAAGAAPGTAMPNAVPTYLVSDAVNYAASHTGSLLTTFPFLAQPL